MLFEEYLFGYVLGLWNASELVDMAVCGLQEGYCSNSLNILAGEDASCIYLGDAVKLIDRALDEIGVSKPDLHDAVISLVYCFCQKISDRQIDSLEGLKILDRVFKLASDLFDDVSFLRLLGCDHFYCLYCEYEEIVVKNSDASEPIRSISGKLASRKQLLLELEEAILHLADQCLSGDLKDYYQVVKDSDLELLENYTTDMHESEVEYYEFSDSKAESLFYSDSLTFNTEFENGYIPKTDIGAIGCGIEFENHYDFKGPVAGLSSPYNISEPLNEKVKGFQVDPEKAIDYISELVNTKGSVVEKMQLVIDFGEKEIEYPHWDVFRSIDYDVKYMVSWLNGVIKECPPEEDIVALWFGIFNSYNDGFVSSDLYVCGSFDKNANLDDIDWACDQHYFPDNAYSKSTVLDELYRTAYQRRGLGVNAEYLLCFAYSVFAVEMILSDIDVQQLFKTAEQKIRVAVGFDDGDYIMLGDLTCNGFVR